MKRRRFTFVGFGFAVLDASCALKFTDYPVGKGSGGGGASATSSGSAAATVTGATTGSPASTGNGNPLCGNGFLDPLEQCDDGNKFNLDGCSSTCKYEPIARMTSVVIQNNTTSFCTTNIIGTKAVTGVGLPFVNQTLKTSIDNGQTNVLAEAGGMTDLTGVTNPMMTLGILSAGLDMQKGAWPGQNPIDWWFIADHNDVDAMGLPKKVIPNGVVNMRNLTAGPGDIVLSITLAGSPATLDMRSTYVAATINATPAPNAPSPPPSQVAGIKVFQTITGNGQNQGLCGNITVESLANTPVPPILLTMFPCADCGASSHTYTSQNSLLDVLVGGCIASFCGSATVVNGTQPDVGSSGTPKTLSLGASNHIPASQTAGNTDGYSVYMTFDANRAHVTGENCNTTPDCQTGKTCSNSLCK